MAVHSLRATCRSRSGPSHAMSATGRAPKPGSMRAAVQAGMRLPAGGDRGRTDPLSASRTRMQTPACTPQGVRTTPALRLLCGVRRAAQLLHHWAAHAAGGLRRGGCFNALLRGASSAMCGPLLGALQRKQAASALAAPVPACSRTWSMQTWLHCAGRSYPLMQRLGGLAQAAPGEVFEDPTRDAPAVRRGCLAAGRGQVARLGCLCGPAHFACASYAQCESRMLVAKHSCMLQVTGCWYFWGGMPV